MSDTNSNYSEVRDILYFPPNIILASMSQRNAEGCSSSNFSTNLLFARANSYFDSLQIIGPEVIIFLKTISKWVRKETFLTEQVFVLLVSWKTTIEEHKFLSS